LSCIWRAQLYMLPLPASSWMYPFGSLVLKSNSTSAPSVTLQTKIEWTCPVGSAKGFY
jgi:hypothetical protein